jgi:hypothetical protein
MSSPSTALQMFSRHWQVAQAFQVRQNITDSCWNTLWSQNSIHITACLLQILWQTSCALGIFGQPTIRGLAVLMSSVTSLSLILAEYFYFNILMKTIRIESVCVSDEVYKE